MAFVNNHSLDLGEASRELHAFHGSRKNGSSPKKDNSLDEDVKELLHSLILNRYEIISTLGAGSFAHVFEAFDHQDKRRVAIKIAKDKTGSHNIARNEIEILKVINRNDPNLSQNIVELKEYFLWRGRLCLVLELLNKSLRYLLEKSGLNGFSLNLTAKFARQLCETLEFFSHPEINIVHCDIKPENIILCGPKSASIKIVDFGGSYRPGGFRTIVIQTLTYRSPESLLEIKFDGAGDIWAVACVLMEIYTGHILFSGTCVLDQMNKIIEVLGMPPVSLIEKSSKLSVFFEKDVNGKYIPRTPVGGKAYSPPGSKSIFALLRNRGNSSGERSHLTFEEFLFEDLISRMLNYNYIIRPTAQEVLQDQFFRAVALNVWSPVRSKKLPVQ